METVSVFFHVLARALINRKNTFHGTLKAPGQKNKIFPTYGNFNNICLYPGNEK